MSEGIAKKAIAEFIGTFILVLFGTASVVISLMMSKGVTPATPFNIGIGAIGGLGDWLAIGLAFGLALIVCIYAFGRISGAHLNPAVTIGLWSIKKFPTSDLIPYIVAQILGAIVASTVVFFMIGPESASVGALGAVAVFPGMTVVGAFIAEFLGTFLLMLAVMAVAVDKNATPGFGALTIGLVVAGIVISIGNISGAGINPARVIGPVIGNFAFAGANMFGSLWIYIIAPILGAIVAAYVYEYIYSELGY